MLTTREDCWPDDENPCERYLHVSSPDNRLYWSRIEIMAEVVYADDTDIIIKSKEELEDWIRVLRKAWRIKVKQDKKGWRPRE